LGILPLGPLVGALKDLRHKIALVLRFQLEPSSTGANSQLAHFPTSASMSLRSATHPDFSMVGRVQAPSTGPRGPNWGHIPMDESVGGGVGAPTHWHPLAPDTGLGLPGGRGTTRPDLSPAFGLGFTPLGITEAGWTPTATEKGEGVALHPQTCCTPLCMPWAGDLSRPVAPPRSARA